MMACLRIGVMNLFIQKSDSSPVKLREVEDSWQLKFARYKKGETFGVRCFVCLVNGGTWKPITVDEDLRIKIIIIIMGPAVSFAELLRAYVSLWSHPLSEAQIQWRTYLNKWHAVLLCFCSKGTYPPPPFRKAVALIFKSNA